MWQWTSTSGGREDTIDDVDVLDSEEEVLIEDADDADEIDDHDAENDEFFN
jgi:hypothetical protein